MPHTMPKYRNNKTTKPKSGKNRQLQAMVWLAWCFGRRCAGLHRFTRVSLQLNNAPPKDWKRIEAQRCAFSSLSPSLDDVRTPLFWLLVEGRMASQNESGGEIQTTRTESASPLTYAKSADGSHTSTQNPGSTKQCGFHFNHQV